MSRLTACLTCAKKNLYLNQLLARQENIKWHYKPVISDSADQFFGSGCGAAALIAIDRQQVGFGDGGFAHMQGAAVTLIEGRGDPALYGEDVPQSRPAVRDSRGLEFHAQELNALVVRAW